MYDTYLLTYRSKLAYGDRGAVSLRQLSFLLTTLQGAPWPRSDARCNVVNATNIHGLDG